MRSRIFFLLLAISCGRGPAGLSAAALAAAGADGAPSSTITGDVPQTGPAAASARVAAATGRGRGRNRPEAPATVLPFATPSPCESEYALAHAGCQLPSGAPVQCGTVALVHASAARTTPPWGQRWRYDSGGRTVAETPFSNVAACALTCWAVPSCRGFVVVANKTCFAVNDTFSTVGTREESQSFNFTRASRPCKPSCEGDGDGLAFETDRSVARPVAAVGGLAQCEQYCDLEAAASARRRLDNTATPPAAVGGGDVSGRAALRPELGASTRRSDAASSTRASARQSAADGGCVGVVHDPVGNLCWTVNSTAASWRASAVSSYLRRPLATALGAHTKSVAHDGGARAAIGSGGGAVATAASALRGQLPELSVFVAAGTDRVFADARPTQTAFCRGGRGPAAVIDWAAAPGQHVAAQLALSASGGSGLLHVEIEATDLVMVPAASAQAGSHHAAADADINTKESTRWKQTRSERGLASGAAVPSSAIELSQVGLVFATPTVEYASELGNASGWYPDVLQPLLSNASATSWFEAAATGATPGRDTRGGGGSTLGYRFAFDTGGRQIGAPAHATTLPACQEACLGLDACRGVFFNATTCVLTNDSAVLVPTALAGDSHRRLRSGMSVADGGATRSVWVGLTVPRSLPPGRYNGSVVVEATAAETATDGGSRHGRGSSVVGAAGGGSDAAASAEAGDTAVAGGGSGAAAASGGVADGAPRQQRVSVPISLEVWPIDAACLDGERRRFGAAYGFDHAVVPQLYPQDVDALDRFANFTADRHVSSSSLTAWSYTVNGTPGVMNRRVIERLLEQQDLFPAAELGITPHSPNASDINATWVARKLDAIAPRMRQLAEWGVANASYVYAFDEAGPEYEPAVRLLFGEVRRRWPGVKTLAVLNWNASAVVDYVDVLVFQYQLLANPGVLAARHTFAAAGKRVWAYHCISPAPAEYLNTFVDVAPFKARLIPWLASAEGFDGWLYWYTNWGSRHAPNAVDTSTNRPAPLRLLDDATGWSSYDPRVFNPAMGSRFSNEDGNLVYAGERGPQSSVRLEQFRLGWEDRALLALLDPGQRLTLAERLVRGATKYTFDAALLESTRRDAARLAGVRRCPAGKG